MATERQYAGSRRLHVLLWVAAGLVIYGWSSTVGGQLHAGYRNSGEVLDMRERLVVLAREKEDLTDEVAHARTDEGRDEQVKILFGAGEPEDVLLEVHLKPDAPEEPPPAVGLGERTRIYICAMTDAFLKACARMRDVWQYLMGQNPLPPPTNNETSDADQL